MVGRIWLTILNTPGTPAGAADPIACGHPAPGPGMWGMSGRLVGWLIGHSKSGQSTNQPIDQTTRHNLFYSPEDIIIK